MFSRVLPQSHPVSIIALFSQGYHATPAKQKEAERDVEQFRKNLGPFVTAAETTRMAMVFTNTKQDENPIVFANDAFLLLTGYDRADVLAADFDS